MSQVAFSKKQIKFTITLGEGVFGDTLSDTVELEGFRSLAELQNPGGESMGLAQIKIYGLKPETINQLTSIGTINKSVRLKNSVFVDAGDDETGLSNVFQGTIFDAWADYNNAPDIGFNIIAYSGLSASLKPVKPTSYTGAADVSAIMQDLAKEAGLQFEDYGVSVQLSNPYFQGTALAKIRACARAANIFHVVERGSLIISPRDKARGSETQLISKDADMVGYPTLSSKGLQLKTAFNNSFLLGGDVRVQSAVTMACGLWRLSNLSHSISCEMPDGPWFSMLEAYNVGQ